MCKVISWQQWVSLIGIAVVLTGCNKSVPDTRTAARPESNRRAGENSFSTTFLQTENPVSEDGAWVGGSGGGKSFRAGHLRYGWRLWGDVQTREGVAYGVDEPTEFGDPTAILAGNWGPEQTATATVRVSKVPTGGCCHEVELRLRTTIKDQSITGYEAYCSVMPDNQYCHIARWNGPNGSYWNFEPQQFNAYLVDGDVITATASGTNPTTITLYRNQKQILQAKDFGAAGGGFGAFGPWTSGNPGIGFFDNHDRNWQDFGLASFSASDGSR